MLDKNKETDYDNKEIKNSIFKQNAPNNNN